MELSPVKIAWGDYENETLIHNHKMSKIYKKRYQRASDLYNSMYRFFGLITVVSSSIASTAPVAITPTRRASKTKARLRWRIDTTTWFWFMKAMGR